MTGALTDAGAAIAARLPRGRVPAGEARNLHVGGARYVSLIGQGNAWFHHQDDRYPAAVTADACRALRAGCGRGGNAPRKRLTAQRYCRVVACTGQPLSSGLAGSAVIAMSAQWWYE